MGVSRKEWWKARAKADEVMCSARCADVVLGHHSADGPGSVFANDGHHMERCLLADSPVRAALPLKIANDLVGEQPTVFPRLGLGSLIWIGHAASMLEASASGATAGDGGR